jgi:tripartite-type tricarboxylate transporter receptor subunit TctC
MRIPQTRHKHLFFGIFCFLLNVSASWGQTQEPVAQFPSKPITLVVNFPTGGGTDILARMLGNYFSDVFGQTAVIENRPGASGNLGAKHVADKAPDGYSLLMVNSSFAINPGVFTNMPFDPKKDFIPLINVAFVPSVMVVPADSPYKKLSDLIAEAKPVKNTVSFGSCGNGTPQHLAGAVLNINANTHITHVPYTGCGPALRDVLGGQVPMAIITASSAAPHIKSGKLIALAITSAERTAQLPNVPTVAEQGYPGYQINQWHGLLAPANMPAALQAKLFDRMLKIVQNPEVKEKLLSMGYTPAYDDPAAFKKIVHDDIDRFAKITKLLGLKSD